MDENPGRSKLQLRHTPVEIERKFLIANDAWRQLAVRSVGIRDGLIALYKDRKVRVRIAGDIATIAIKAILAKVCDHGLQIGEALLGQLGAMAKLELRGLPALLTLPNGQANRLPSIRASAAQ